MDTILSALSYLRELNMCSVVLRLFLAMLFSGLIGIERETKRLPAGFRTYMLVCLGAALATLLSQYEYVMIHTRWAAAATEVGVIVDVSRLGAQVINGMGFLAAGTIVMTNYKEIRGAPTAASLWACACMGLAVGVGFYECVIVCFVLIYASNKLLPDIEKNILSHTRNVSIYVEFESVQNVGDIIKSLKSKCVEVFDIELQKNENTNYHNAVFTLRLPKGKSAETFISDIIDLDYVYHAESA